MKLPTTFAFADKSETKFVESKAEVVNIVDAEPEAAGQPGSRDASYPKELWVRRHRKGNLLFSGQLAGLLLENSPGGRAMRCAQVTTEIILNSSLRRRRTG